jgi:hypothetical protein
VPEVKVAAMFVLDQRHQGIGGAAGFSAVPDLCPDHLAAGNFCRKQAQFIVKLLFGFFSQLQRNGSLRSVSMTQVSFDAPRAMSMRKPLMSDI